MRQNGQSPSDKNAAGVSDPLEQDHQEHRHQPAKNAAGSNGQHRLAALVIDSSLAKALRPVNEQVIASLSTIRAEKGTRIFSETIEGAVTYDTRNQASLSSRVSGRIEKLNIQYNYQPVQKGQPVMEIYSPDLVAAQRDLLLLSKDTRDAEMFQRAKQKLLLLGMRDPQIDQLLRSGEVMYRVPVYSTRTGYILERSGSTSPASQLMIRIGEYVTAGQPLFTIYGNETMIAEFAFDPALATTLQKGQKLIFHKTGEPGTTYTSHIGLVQPVFRDGINFTLARIYLTGKDIRAGELLTAVIPVSRSGWWLPERAIVDLGSNAVVFKKENGVFVPKRVKAIAKIDNMALIEEDLENWEVASNAAYLVDSESFIKSDNKKDTDEKNRFF